MQRSVAAFTHIVTIRPGRCVSRSAPGTTLRLGSPPLPPPRSRSHREPAARRARTESVHLLIQLHPPIALAEMAHAEANEDNRGTDGTNQRAPRRRIHRGSAGLGAHRHQDGDVAVLFHHHHDQCDQMFRAATSCIRPIVTVTVRSIVRAPSSCLFCSPRVVAAGLGPISFSATEATWGA